MQRLLAFLMVSASLLAGCAATQAVDSHVSRPTISPKPAPVITAPATEERATTYPYTTTVPPESSAPQTTAPYPPATGAGTNIALILPLKSPAFGPAADAVRRGFMAALETSAHTQAKALPTKIYGTGDQPDDILRAYQSALEDGARIIVGPLTRNGVTALAGSGLVTVPTLALNQPDQSIALPPGMYLFGLSVETESRQIARLAFNDGKVNAMTVAANTPLAKRSQQAFVEEWQRLGGRIAAQLTVSDASTFPAIRDALSAENPDMVFLAADYQKARLIRPYISMASSIYATSQVNNGKDDPAHNIDLNGVEFLDMPWVLQPDHPAVMIYPHPTDFPSVDLERLYALGIDAFRLAHRLAEPNPQQFSLDGVTGQIRFDGSTQITRQLMPAVFIQGEAVILDQTVP
jgi:outer membrane PBP1 activator LpoA protein